MPCFSHNGFGSRLQRLRKNVRKVINSVEERPLQGRVTQLSGRGPQAYVSQLSGRGPQAYVSQLSGRAALQGYVSQFSGRAALQGRVNQLISVRALAPVVALAPVKDFSRALVKRCRFVLQ